MEKPILNLASILLDSSTNGPGNRDVIWVQGCSIRCPGCFNEHLWDFKERYLIPVDHLIEKFQSRLGCIEGVSILGGEPIHQSFSLSYLLKGLQALKLTTVVYTGFNYEYLTKQNDEWINAVLEHTDILVDGPFHNEKKDTSLTWRGSTNQRILFLSKRYSELDIPENKNNINAEIHLFDADEIQTVKTGIRKLG